MLYKEEKIKSEEFLNLKKKGEELLYEAPNKKAVTALQSFLNEEGYTDQNGEKLWEDGRYDANTANAVLRYQNENGLKGDGITGDKTWNHIYNKKRKKEEEASFTEEQKERSNQNLNVIRQEQINLDIEPEGFIYGEEEEATSSGAFYDVQEGNEESSADISGAEEESFNDRVNRNWENGEEDTLPEIKDYDATQDEGDDVDYSSIFAYESPIGTLTLASELSPDMLPAPIPAYNPNGIAFKDYVVSDESVPRASGGNYERVFPPRIPVSENNTFAIGKPEATLKSNPGSKESGEGEAEEKNWLWDYIRNPKETVIRFAKEAGKTIDEAQKEVQRKIWRLGADNYLRKNKYYVSAYMLEHSLQDNPTSMTLGNESDIAELIKNDPVYLDALDKAIANSDGKTIDVPLKDIQFNKKDLYYSIHRATIHVKGYKNGEGKWIITAMLEDTYDFTEWMTVKFENGKLSFDIRTGTVANDVAKISQSTGAVNPYMVRVYFNTIR